MGDVVDGLGGTGLVGDPGSLMPDEPTEPVELADSPDVSPIGTSGSQATTLNENKTAHPRVQAMSHRDTRSGPEHAERSTRDGSPAWQPPPSYRLWNSLPKKYVSDPPK